MGGGARRRRALKYHYSGRRLAHSIGRRRGPPAPRSGANAHASGTCDLIDGGGASTCSPGSLTDRFEPPSACTSAWTEAPTSPSRRLHENPVVRATESREVARGWTRPLRYDLFRCTLVRSTLRRLLPRRESRLGADPPRLPDRRFGWRSLSRSWPISDVFRRSRGTAYIGSDADGSLLHRVHPTRADTLRRVTSRTEPPRTRAV